MGARFTLISPWLAGAAVVAFGSVAVAGVPLSPPTPPLLMQARAGGGWYSGGCPPRADEVAYSHGPEARSPNVEDRLTRQFPPGTLEQRLFLALQNQGFKIISPCDNDPMIHRAVFSQKGGGNLWGPYPVSASVAWKVDDLGRIVWTKAFVAYTGP